MKNHIAVIKSIAHQLKEVGLPVDDREVMTKIISTLPVIYQTFCLHVVMYPSLTSLLIQEEKENSKLTPAQAGSINKQSALSVNSTMWPPLVEESSRHMKIIARTMEMVYNGPIRKPSTSTQMVRPIPTEPIIKGEAGVVAVVVEATKETRSIPMEVEVISLSTLRIVA
jgi:hypothetical protein